MTNISHHDSYRSLQPKINCTIIRWNEMTDDANRSASLMIVINLQENSQVA